MFCLSGGNFFGDRDPHVVDRNGALGGVMTQEPGNPAEPSSFHLASGFLSLLGLAYRHQLRHGFASACDENSFAVISDSDQQI